MFLFPTDEGRWAADLWSCGMRLRSIARLSGNEIDLLTTKDQQKENYAALIFMPRTINFVGWLKCIDWFKWMCWVSSEDAGFKGAESCVFVVVVNRSRCVHFQGNSSMLSAAKFEEQIVQDRSPCVLNPSKRRNFVCTVAVNHRESGLPPSQSWIRFRRSRRVFGGQLTWGVRASSLMLIDNLLISSVEAEVRQHQLSPQPNWSSDCRESIWGTNTL